MDHIHLDHSAEANSDTLPINPPRETDLPALPTPPSSVPQLTHSPEHATDFADLLAEFEDGASSSKVEGELEQDEEVPIVSDTAAQAASEPETPSADHLILPQDKEDDSLALGQRGEEPLGADGLIDSSGIPKPAETVIASALFADDNATDFDGLIPTTSLEQQTPVPHDNASHQSPIPTLLIEDEEHHPGDSSVQSLFSNDSDWLADTTMGDDSFAIDPVGTAAISAEADQSIPVDVPEGWYGDDGQWNWYTDEEKEQVRQSMLLDAPDIGNDSLGVVPATSSTFSRSASPTPAVDHGFSENSARRTPQPEQGSFSAQPSPYDPYGPSTSTTTSYDPYSAPSTSSYSSSTGPSPYAPSSSPYAPIPSPYGPASSSSSYDPYAAAPVPAKKSATLAPAQRPEPPKRVASNAYDPPFLRPQKSFIRAPSAMSMASAFQAGPSTSASPPPIVAPPAPPPGPPRRSDTRQRSPPQSSYPSFEPALSIEQELYPPQPHSQQSDYYSRPPPPVSAPSTISHKPPPPRTASYNAFDPPLRPASATSRPPPRAFTPPVVAISPPPPLPTYIAPPPPPPPALAPPPSRPVSRGPPPRKASPMFETRPPSRSATKSRQGPSPLSNGAEVAYVEEPREAVDTPPRRVSLGVDTHELDDKREMVVPRDLDVAGEEGRGLRWDDGPGADSGIPRSSTPVADRGIDAYDEDTGGSASLPQAEKHSSGYDSYDPFKEGESASQYDAAPYAAASYAPPQQSTYDLPRSDTPPKPPMPFEEEEESPPKPPPASQVYDPYAPSASEQDTGEGHKRTGPLTHDYKPDSAVETVSTYGQSPYAPYAPPSTDVSQDPHGYANIPTASDSSPYGPPPSSNRDREVSRIATSAYEPSPYAPSTSQVSRDAPSTYEPSPYAPFTNPARDNYQTHETTGYDPSPYAPSNIAIPPQTNDMYARTASPTYTWEYGISPPQANYFQSMSMQPPDDTYIPQQVLEQRPVSEDPLGRCTLAARNTPLAVFGFGGVLVTAFPGATEEGGNALGHARMPSYGYASGRGQLYIRGISDIIAPSALKSNDAVFPGPLLSDSATPKGMAGDKKKRDAVMAYLEARAEEVEKGLPYLTSSASVARREEEGKLVLIKLLIAMIIGEGKLSGNTKVEDAVRSALSNSSDPDPTIITGMTANAASSPIASFSTQNATTAPATATSQQLKHLSSLLVGGDKRDAVQYAAGAGLWSHALIISSCVDQELWKEIVLRFSKAETGTGAGLKAAYALYSGQVVSSVDELVEAANIGDDADDDHWREVLSVVVFNGRPAELACLDELGSRFLSAGLVNASHACHLLSPTSPFSDITPAAFDRIIAFTQDARGDDSIIFAEIAEYARSLAPIAKGQELAIPGLPQLLPYKLQRAWQAAEVGDSDQAQRYCKAVSAVSKPSKSGQSVLPHALRASLEDLLERLNGTPSTNPVNLLGGRKSGAKPGLDKLGSWIEGRLTKFIAGEEDPNTTQTVKKIPPPPGGKAGPFSHFSTISASRTPSTADLRSLHAEHGSTSRLSPSSGAARLSGEHNRESSSSSYGDDYGASRGNGFTPWGSSLDIPLERDDAPREGEVDETEFIDPMAGLSLGPKSDYVPPVRGVNEINLDDEDDLGFGNKALSRGKTPQPVAGAGNGEKATETKTTTAPVEAPANDSGGKAEQPKSGWLGRWWGKKEGEGSGPIRAKLGEESSMVFDKDLKRWVVKGAKPDATPAAAPPPPPSRAQTASPSRAARPEAASSRAMSATPPPSQQVRSGISMSPAGPPPGPPSRTPTSTDALDGATRRQKSTLSESVVPEEGSKEAGPGPGPVPTPPASAKPPSGPPSRPGSSLDDLLSRPPGTAGRRVASGAKKPMRNRYVDVFQPGAEGS